VEWRMRSIGERTRSMDRLRRFLTGHNRARLMLTLSLAVMLPAAALIFLSFAQLRSMERDKTLEAAFHRDFLHMLAISEKQINIKAYALVEDVRGDFPSPDGPEATIVEQLDCVLSEHPWISHAFLFDGEHEDGFIVRTHPSDLGDPYARKEHDQLEKLFAPWFGFEGKGMLAALRKKSRPIGWYNTQVKRAKGYAHATTAYFTLPRAAKDRLAVGGIMIRPEHLKNSFFPQMLDSLIAQKLGEEGGNPLAMVVTETVDPDAAALALAGWQSKPPLAASASWTDGKPEVTRNFDDVFRGLTLGIKFKGTSVEAIGRSWVRRSLMTLGVLSVLLVGGLILTYRSVTKEVALARLKSDFVSNVSHELRTPLALIRLYAETLELGRIKSREKYDEYYRIIRKESERLTALINNILDFSRIEAGRAKYDFRKTDLADLVTNTLDTYRDQIDEQGFTFEQTIEPGIPPVDVDREAIARSLVNLVNNALKYSDRDRFIGVRLYRADGVLKLEVADRGIGIARSEQARIFEKFYRAGDPLVHNTKGSGLGLSLVRHIAHAHGGEIEVESAPGKGSTFTLTLPIAPAPEQRTGAASMEVAG
jgi:signal transduction histidine kinase